MAQDVYVQKTATIKLPFVALAVVLKTIVPKQQMPGATKFITYQYWAPYVHWAFHENAPENRGLEIQNVTRMESEIQKRSE